MNDDETLLHLKHCGKVGLYQQAMRYYFMRSIERQEVDPFVTIQYAVALQHYGRYLESLAIYEDAIIKCEAIAPGFNDKGLPTSDLLYNLKLQTAVIAERLLEVNRAVEILNEIGDPHGRTDLEIAAASLTSWYYLTRLKCHMLLGQIDRVRHFCRECINQQDKHRLLGDWGRLYLTLLDIRSKKTITTKDFDALTLCIENVGAYDPPGQPWLGLMAGFHIMEDSPGMARSILEDAAKQSSILGKFYLVGVVSEILANCYALIPGAAHNIELTVNRSISAYNKCQLLTPAMSKIRNRLLKFCLSTKLWDASDLMDKLMQAIGAERIREELIFANMCKSRAQITGSKPHIVFERFVSDWANTRFFGRLIGEPNGQPTADSIIVRVVNGNKVATIVQAKHYKTPKKCIPRQLHLRDLTERYAIDQVERYVLVVSTSDATGWRPEMWHYQDELKVRNLVPTRQIEVVVVTEPELQTDVALSDTLYYKYFNI